MSKTIPTPTSVRWATATAVVVLDQDGIRLTDLAGSMTYASLTAGAVTRPLAQIWAHVFNHHTHHRGQAHAALTRLGQEAPPLDLIYWVDPMAGVAA